MKRKDIHILKSDQGAIYGMPFGCGVRCHGQLRTDNPKRVTCPGCREWVLKKYPNIRWSRSMEYHELPSTVNPLVTLYRVMDVQRYLDGFRREEEIRVKQAETRKLQGQPIKLGSNYGSVPPSRQIRPEDLNHQPRSILSTTQMSSAPSVVRPMKDVKRFTKPKHLK